ncbi:hypothetical protein OG21DRAFT_1508792 [Imleria badia]|nr:hypothetical protein OG21DRAFT_1508792 [Imleria badia]
MRPLIPYDLEGSPSGPSAPPAPPAPTPQFHARRPPTKKRKRYQNPQSGPPHKAVVQHWDDPGSASVGMIYDDHEESVNSAAVPVAAADDVDADQEEYGEVGDWDEGADADFEEEEEEESRPLTNEEIWDDAALIDAWNSAEAEYEAYHGASKTWKSEPVKKSPLWYNKPYTAPPQPGPSKPKPTRPPQEQEEDLDTAPLDFDTYVPTHDPSLAIPSGTGTNPAMTVPPPSTTMVSRDEAFNNALSAMYWGGYWTAVYHCQSQASGKNDSGPAEATEEDEIEADEDEDLVPAQR